MLLLIIVLLLLFGGGGATTDIRDGAQAEGWDPRADPDNRSDLLFDGRTALTR
jgi:hypothetical protein